MCKIYCTNLNLEMHAHLLPIVYSGQVGNRLTFTLVRGEEQEDHREHFQLDAGNSSRSGYSGLQMKGAKNTPNPIKTGISQKTHFLDFCQYLADLVY